MDILAIHAYAFSALINMEAKIMSMCVNLDRVDRLVEQAVASPPPQRKALLAEALELFKRAGDDPSTNREELKVHFWRWGTQ